MKHFNFLSNFRWFTTVILLITLGIGQMWGACNTYTLGWGAASGSSGTYTNFSATSGSVSGLVSFASQQNDAANAPAYNSTNKQLRLYFKGNGNGCSVTLTPVDGVTITGFVMTCATSPSVKYTADGGTATSVTPSSKVYTVTGIAATSSLKIQNVNTTNTQLQISTLQISYTYEPTSLTNGAIGSTTAHLSWSDSHSVGHYDVYRSTSNTAPGINTTPTVSNTTNTYVDLTSLNESTTYYWWVRSNNSCKSAWIAGTSFTTSAAVSTYTIYVPDTYGSCSTIGSYTSDKGTEGSGTGTWTGYKTYSGITAGTSVTITATPESGYKFDGWTSGGYSIIMDEETEEVTPSSTTSTTATFDMPSSDVYIMECAFSTASCSANPTIGNASLNGSISLSSIPLSISSVGGGTDCTLAEYGFVWKAGSAPSASDNKTKIGESSSATSFTGNITGSFSTGVTYYIKGYAINNGPNTTLSSTALTITPQSVTFNSNGGSSVSTAYVNNGATVSKPSNPTKTGYTFGTWQLSGSDYNFSTTVTDNITLDATWNAKTTAITLNKNNSDASGSTAGSASYTYGESTKNSYTAATRTGYTLNGYYTATSDGTKILNADGSIAGSSIVVSTVTYTDGSGNWAYDNTALTLYAQWTIKSYSVTWKVNNTNYTTGTPTSSVNHGSHVTTLPTAPDPGSYCGDKFMGWTDATDGAYVHGTSNLYTKASEFPNATAAQTFYAVFADYED